jgi:hypothetical protein
MQLLIFVIGIGFVFSATFYSALGSQEALTTASVTFSLLVLLAALAIRRDAFRAAQPVLVFGLLACAISGAVVRFLDGDHPYASALCALGLLVAIWAGRLIWRVQRAPEPLGDLLRRQAHGPIFELDGVQLTVAPRQQALRPGAEGQLILIAQNCWDRPRRLKIGVGRAGVYFGVRGELLWQAPQEVTLPPAAVLALEVPLWARPGTKGVFTLVFRVEIGRADRPGTRVRIRRAAALQQHGAAVQRVFGGLGDSRAKTLSAVVQVKGKAAEPPIKTVDTVAAPVWTVLQEPSQLEIGVAKRSLEALGYRMS